jgi:glycosyltransferase involved in cell wall biosynthesis
MKVSLVTTVLNEEKTIEKFLDSVISQTRKPEEVVIVDGGSTDETLEKVQKFKSSKVQSRGE